MDFFLHYFIRLLFALRWVCDMHPQFLVWNYNYGDALLKPVQFIFTTYYFENDGDSCASKVWVHLS